MLQVADLAHEGGWDLLVPILLELGTKLCDAQSGESQYVLGFDNHPESPVTYATHPLVDLQESSASAEEIVAATGVRLVAKCFKVGQTVHHLLGLNTCHSMKGLRPGAQRNTCPNHLPCVGRQGPSSAVRARAEHGDQ